MFNFDIEHRVWIDPDSFTDRLREDTLERLAALHAKSGTGPGAFNGNTVAGMLDGDSVGLTIVSVNYPYESTILGGIIGVVTWYEGQRIHFDVRIDENVEEQRFMYNVVHESFRAGPTG